MILFGEFLLRGIRVPAIISKNTTGKKCCFTEDLGNRVLNNANRIWIFWWFLSNNREEMKRELISYGEIIKISFI